VAATRRPAADPSRVNGTTHPHTAIRPASAARPPSIPSQGTRPLPAASAPAALPAATTASVVAVAVAPVRRSAAPRASTATGKAAPSRRVGGTMIRAARIASITNPESKVVPQVR